MNKKTCIKCGEILTEDNWPEYLQRVHHYVCRLCRNRIARNTRSTTKSKARYKAYYRKKKEWAIEYKGGRCSRCGLEDPCLSLYEFHHVDPTAKDFKISERALTQTKKRQEDIKKELDKCLLVCCNCHRKIHWELSNEQKNLEAGVVPAVSCVVHPEKLVN
jgi:hypothetical protein